MATTTPLPTDASGATADAYDEHCLRLRDVADADDPRCPDDLDGCLVVTYDATTRPNSSYTEVRSVSARLPTELLVVFDHTRVPAGEIDDATREWIRAASARYGNAIDFAGTETGP